jgi:hypothetical protein
MTDKREQILARLFTVLQAIPGIEQHVRNRGELPDEKRPAITMLDADEIADERPFAQGRITAFANRMIMTPEIYVALKDQKPDNLTAGQLLNGFRVAIIKAVMTDAELKDLVGSNGEIRYEGCVTDLARGRTMAGEILIRFAFVYVLNPSQL